MRRCCMERDVKGKFKKGNGLQDLSGERFGRLVAVKLSEKRSGRKTFWDCLCDCGNKKTVRTDSLKDGSVRSCGCLKKEQDKKNLPNGQGVVTHGLSKERIYRTWNGMKRRCEDKNDERYSSYGERGIKVCDEWQDVVVFSEWALSNGYEEHLTIDRIDVNGNYEPSNCQWATWSEQAKNKRNSVRIEYDGKSQLIGEWCEELGLNLGTITTRYYAYGIRPPHLFKKERLESNKNHYLTHEGRTQTITQWAKEIGINPSTLVERVKRGIEQPKLFYSGSLNSYNKDKKIPR